MSVEVLIASMNQMDHSLLDKMNINSDVIVGNQCNYNSIEEFNYKGKKALYLNFKEKGVGLNRNNALMRARAEYCLFADDDEVLYAGYEEIISNSFEQHPEADVIIFNIVGRDKGRNKTEKLLKINRLNYLKYGTARIAIRLKSVRTHGVFFNQTFGGGTEHCHGEDNLFLTDCLKKKMKVIAVPEFIGELQEDRESTWDNGFDDKYFFDQGLLYRRISRTFWPILCFRDALKRHSTYKRSFRTSFTLMIRGAIKEC